MSTSNLYIIIYIVLWAVTFCYYWKKKKVFGAGNLILASYLAYSVLSFFLYNHPYYQWNETDNDLKLFPFIYLFLMMLVFLQPVLKYDETCYIQQPSSSLLNILSYLFIISSILVLPYILSNLAEGIFFMIVSDSGAEELYADAHSGYLSGQETPLAYRIFHGIFDVFSDFGILLFFIQAIKPETKKTMLIGLALGIFVGMVETLSMGLRTQLVMKFLLIITTFFLLRYHLPPKTNSLFKYVGYVLIGFVSFFVIIINVSRYSNRSYDSSYQLLNYTGMANLQFDKYCLDAGGTRNGDRTFNYFKKWLRFKGVPDGLEGIRDKYSGKMKLDDSQFSTYVGDFVLDFGPSGAALILCISSMFFSRLTRRSGNQILFHQLILLFFVMSVCVQGGMYLFYYSVFRNYYIVYLIMFYFIFKMDYNIKVKNKAI